MRNRLGLNEILIVNPSARGGNAMLHRGNMGRFAQAPDDDADLYGVGEEWLGQDADDDFYGSIPMDELGSIPMDELQGTSCLGCATPQVGYYSDDPDHELIGAYCPSCGKVGMGPYPDEPVQGLGQHDWDEAVGQYPGEEEGYVEGVGRFAQGPDAAQDEEIPGLEEWPDDVSGLADEDAELVARYGQGDNGAEDLGQDADDDLTGYGQADDELDGYVDERPPAFNPTCDPGGALSGYEPERSVNPTVALRRTVPATPLRNVPDIFKPYF